MIYGDPSFMIMVKDQEHEIGSLNLNLKLGTTSEGFYDVQIILFIAASIHNRIIQHCLHFYYISIPDHQYCFLDHSLRLISVARGCVCVIGFVQDMYLIIEMEICSIDFLPTKHLSTIKKTLHKY